LLLSLPLRLDRLPLLYSSLHHRFRIVHEAEDNCMVGSITLDRVQSLEAFGWSGCLWMGTYECIHDTIDNVIPHQLPYRAVASGTLRRTALFAPGDHTGQAKVVSARNHGDTSVDKGIRTQPALHSRHKLSCSIGTSTVGLSMLLPEFLGPKW
jgi:hypothetical protein